MSKDTDDGSPDFDIPEKSWTNPFRKGTFLHEIYGKVVSENRDLVIIVSDLRGRRGTGKTVTSLKLADLMDRTDEGVTFENCTLSAEELHNAYSDLPEGSGLVLDEGEVAAGNRSAMTKTNKALRKVMSMARVEEKYLIVNVPIKGFIDTDILKLADVWIAMKRRGNGLVHHLKWEPYSETLHTEKKQTIEIADIETGTDLRKVYNKLTREKQKHIDGEKGNGYIEKKEHESQLKKAVNQAKRDKRDEIVRGLFEHPEVQKLALSQRMVGEAIGVSQTTVGNILQDGD